MSDTGFAFGICTLLLLTAGAGLAGCPQYNVYASRLSGEAKLAEAEASRQVAVREAQAKRDSAGLLAQAEIERAKGVAEANKIIGDSLKGNEDYLRYLWIDGLQNGKGNEVIYVPTEAGLPILEAGKRRRTETAQ
ncbi:MAG: hypothetical protein U0800_12475 [Isosphaeraceae bacterium]